MREHIKAAEAFERQDVPVAEARERFLAEGQDYKVELIDDLVAAAEPAIPAARPSRSTPTAPSPTSAAARTRPSTARSAPSS